MGIDQLDLIKNQAQATLRNKASGAAATLRSQTSLVGQASRLTGRMTQQAGQIQESIIGSRKRAKHIAAEKDLAAEPPRPAKPAQDGYVRRSAIQPVRVARDYYRKIARKIIGTVVLIACCLAVLWLLLQTNLLAY